MPRTFSITLPIYWQITKKKRVLTSMNAYRNWHHHTSSRFKREFAEMVYKQLPEFSFEGRFKTHTKLYYKRSGCDPTNIDPLILKVLLDALISAGILKDDDVSLHQQWSGEVVEKDAANPRCEITFTEITND